MLRRDPGAPNDLRAKSLRLAGELLEMVGLATDGDGSAAAARAIDSGAAWETFKQICEEQGGMRDPPVSSHRHDMTAIMSGEVTKIDNRKLSRIAKLAGAPDDKAAGLEMHVRLGQAVRKGEPLYTIHAEHIGDLKYALGYAIGAEGVIAIGAAR